MATKKEQLEQTQKAIGEFFLLSDYLFGDNAPLDVKEIPQDSPFYSTAKEIADEMELDWQGMSHEDSNRVMLNLLSEYYYRIKPDEKYRPILSITFTKTE